MIGNNWLSLVLLGGVMGALGQGVRAGLGFKKLQDEVGDDGVTFSARFSASRFYTSIFLGFVAGALTAFFMADDNGVISTGGTPGADGSVVEEAKKKAEAATTITTSVTKPTLIALMVAGYAGVDAFEGLASKFIHPKQTSGTTSAISN